MGLISQYTLFAITLFYSPSFVSVKSRVFVILACLIFPVRSPFRRRLLEQQQVRNGQLPVAYDEQLGYCVQRVVSSPHESRGETPRSLQRIEQWIHSPVNWSSLRLCLAKQLPQLMLSHSLSTGRRGRRAVCQSCQVSHRQARRTSGPPVVRYPIFQVFTLSVNTMTIIHAK